MGRVGIWGQVGVGANFHRHNEVNKVMQPSRAGALLSGLTAGYGDSGA